MTLKFITEKSQYKTIVNMAETIVRIETDTHENPVKVNIHRPRYLEFSIFTNNRFGSFLNDLSTSFGDKKVWFFCLTPERTYYLNDKFPTFGAFELSDNWSPDEYRNGLIPVHDNEAHPGFGYFVSTFMIFGDGMDWFVYGDRDWDFLVLSQTYLTEGACDWPIASTLPWLTRDEIAAVILAQADPSPFYQSRARKVIEHLGLTEPSPRRFSGQ